MPSGDWRVSVKPLHDATTPYGSDPFSVAADRWGQGIASESPVQFASTVNPNFIVKRHHELIDAAILKAIKESGRVIISLPPRSGKSYLVSQYLPAWFLGKYPDRRVMLASYEAEFASTWGRKARDILEEHGKRVFNVTVSSKSSAADRWDIAGHEGGMVTAGVGGPLTGKGAHCFPAGVRVFGAEGWVPIQTVLPGDLVLSYNHVIGAPEWKPVKAISNRSAESLVEIRTRAGRILRCTSDHPICVALSGYKKARDLGQRDSLWSFDRPLDSLPSLRGAKVERQSSLPDVLSQTKERNRKVTLLRRMWGAVLSPMDGPQTLSREQSGLLRLGLLSGVGVQEVEANQDLRAVRGSPEAQQSILQGVHNFRPQRSHEAIETSKLRLLRRRVPTRIVDLDVLRPSVCQPGPFYSDDRPRQRTLQRWSERQRSLQEAEAVCDRAGSGMRGLSMPSSVSEDSRWSGSTIPVGASHRSSTVEQRPEELSGALRELPLDSSSFGPDSVALVEPICGGSHRVYDLEVEDNHNFFAEGLLVHNCLIIDDPIKNIEEAQSEVYREKHWDWWTAVALTRLEPGAFVVVCMTRWHQDDLVGRMLAQSGDHWNALTIPALAEDEGDLLGRKPGEALWPERYDSEYLLQRKSEMGTVQFNALYQQRPAPAEGARFKREWFRYWKPIGDERYDVGGGRVYKFEDLIRFFTVDLAVTTKTTSDYTVIGVWGRSRRGDLLLLDLVRKKLEGPDIVPEIRKQAAKWGPSQIAIEAVQFQLAIIQEARRANLPVTQLKADKDKIARALTAEARMESGNIFWEKDAHYTSVLEEELIYFPNGKHDDLVDVLSYGALELAKAGNWAAAYGVRLCWKCKHGYMERYNQCVHCGAPKDEPVVLEAV